MADPQPFDRLDLQAVHHAMVDAEHQAGERQEKMPSSANALRIHAARLRTVREKLLERLPERRRYYP
jgi:hypothetical protein